MVQIVSYKDKLKSSRSEYVYLVQAHSDSKPAWFFAEIEKQKLPLFKEAAKHEPFDLDQYGKVLYSGWGTEPPADITAKLEAEYAA